jgi:ribokinase
MEGNPFSSECAFMFLVLGNVTVDESMTISTWFAPGRTIVTSAPRRDLGGKGANQAIILRRSGAPVRFVTPVGRDAEADWVSAALEAAGFEGAELLRVEAATDRSLIFVHTEGDNAIASTVGAAHAITPETAARYVGTLGAGDALLLQGNLMPGTTRAALAAARARGVRAVFNPSPIAPGFAEMLGLVDLLVLNEGEAEVLGGHGAPLESARALRRAGAGTVVLTLGPRGAVAVDGAGEIVVAARPVNAVDTVGAGDTFTGVLIAALYHHGLALRPAIEAAAAAAAHTIQRRGTVSAFPDAATIAALMKA